MVNFVGAGPGAADLITVRGRNLVEKADVIIYAGSLVNPEILRCAKKDCEIYNSAKMTLEEVIDCLLYTSSFQQYRYSYCDLLRGNIYTCLLYTSRCV